MATAFSIPLVILNIALGLVASFSLYMAPVYFLGHWPVDAAICSGLFSMCCLALYFSWYKTLPNDKDEPDETKAPPGRGTRLIPSK
jgi:hypothetical protein